MNDYKTCPKCGQTKTFSDFYRCKSKKDGFRSHCKLCVSQAAKQKRIDNPEEERAKAKAFREANPEKVAGYMRTYKNKNPDKVKARATEYYANNKDKILDYNKQWAKDNPDKVKQKYNKWASKNPDKIAARKKRHYERNADKIKARSLRNYYANPELAKRNRAAWFAANPQKRFEMRVKRRNYLAGHWQVTSKEINKLYAQPCFYCGQPSAHIDHVVPLSRGGEHRIGNLVGACAKCNLSKHDKFIVEWNLWKKRSSDLL
jgi:5-methylcytosine-specific restriction endonuclease McrA